MATMTQIRQGTLTRTPDLRGIASALAAKLMRFAGAVNGTPRAADPVTLDRAEHTTRAMGQRAQHVDNAIDAWKIRPY